MTTTVYVARSLGVDTGVLVDYPANGVVGVLGPIVGGDDALDTRDGDTSYVGLSWTFSDTAEEMPLRWERLSGPEPSPGTVESITIEAEFRRLDTTTIPNVMVGLGDRGGSGTGVIFAFASGTDYTFFTRPVDPFFLFTITDPGRPWLLTTLDPGIFASAYNRVTYLRLIVEGGESHLRQKNRDSIRARNRASRQRGIRARGYY